MSQASEEIAKQYAEAGINKKNWGTAMYNVLVEGLVGGGVVDDTIALQTLINTAIAAGRKAIFFPHGTNGQYRVTALTNANLVVLFGDNVTFVGGYTGTVIQLGEGGTTQAVFDAFKADNTTKLSLKVDKETGKGLSTNDYINADKIEVGKVVNKADIAYVDTQVAAVASGSPKAVYATAAALATAFPAGNTNIYLVTADGNWYFWNGSAWTAGGVYQSTGIADDSVTAKKLNFLTLVGLASKNLFDKGAVTAGNYVDFTTGNLVPVAGYTASEFIPVSASTIYTKSSVDQFAFYNASKVYISGIASAKTFTTPALAVFVRMTVGSGELNTMQLELGGAETSYEGFSPFLDGTTIRPQTIDAAKLSFYALVGVASKNLFDKSAVTTGFYVEYLTGNLIAVSGYSASDFIPVLGNTIYTKQTVDQLAFYNAAKVYISGITEGATARTFTTPPTAAFVRLTVVNSSLDTLQLELGSTQTSYESFTPKISTDNLPTQSKNTYENVIIVAKSGGMFTTISNAVLAANDSVNNPVTIWVMPGIYEESINLIGRYISIVGINRDTTIIKTYTNDYLNPPIDMASNNHIKNLTIIADDNGTTTPVGGVGGLSAYAIHHDIAGRGYSGASVMGKGSVSNCKLVSKHNAAIGVGLANQQELELDNVEMISEQVYALYAHNYQGSGATGQKLIVGNSKIRTTVHTSAMALQDANHRTGGTADDARDTVFTFYGNMVWSDVYGKINVISKDAPLGAGYTGYIKLGTDSFGNNIAELNA